MAQALRILMIEDDPNDAELLLRKLRSNGFDVYAERVDRLEDVRRAIEQSQWDLALSDHSTPGFRLADVLDLLREPMTPLIVVSGAIGEHEVVEALHLGAASYVDKGSLSRLVPTIERVLAEMQLRREHAIAQRRLELVQAAVESAHDLIVIIEMRSDGTTNVVYVNEAAGRMTGFSAGEIAVRGITGLHGHDTDGAAIERLLDAMTRGEEVTAELLLYHRDGGTRWVETSIRPIPSGERRFVLVSRDITERKNIQAQLAFLAMHDPLTGLANRALLDERLGMELAKARRSGEHVAVMLLDLDNFKYINDTFGHACGDDLLREIGRRLRSCVREVDTVARLGGDEFVVVLTNVISTQHVANTARRILATIREPLLVERRAWTMSASIGIARYPHDARDEKGLLKCADGALYAVKESGKNTFRFKTPAAVAEPAAAE
jgi:diguanylate cyclase (GGDEF)-like protein/PAS domain S-box-containing protein